MKATSFVTRALLIISFTALTACSLGTKIQSFGGAQSFSPNAHSIYAWDHDALEQMRNSTGGELPEFAHILRAHVNEVMAQKGYLLGTPEQADFFMDYSIEVEEEVAAESEYSDSENQQQTNPFGLKWIFGRSEKPKFEGLRPPTDIMTYYQKGTLHLAAISPDQRLLWHSSATKILKDNANEAQRRMALRRAADRMLTKFPSKK